MCWKACVVVARVAPHHINVLNIIVARCSGQGVSCVVAAQWCRFSVVHGDVRERVEVLLAPNLMGLASLQ